jgi:purine-binding chemotaxis protein CheW
MDVGWLERGEGAFEPQPNPEVVGATLGEGGTGSNPEPIIPEVEPFLDIDVAEPDVNINPITELETNHDFQELERLGFSDEPVSEPPDETLVCGDDLIEVINQETSEFLDCISAAGLDPEIPSLPDSAQMQVQAESLDTLELVDTEIQQSPVDLDLHQPIAAIEPLLQPEEEGAKTDFELGDDAEISSGVQLKDLSIDDAAGEAQVPEHPILPLEELISDINRKIGKVPIPKAKNDEETQQPMRVQSEEHRQYIRFLLDNILLAIPLGSALEIGHRPEVTPLPNLPEWILGVSNIRGEIISVVDLSGFFQRSSELDDKASHLVILQNQTMKVGVLVDRVMGILTLDHIDTSIQRSPYRDNGGVSAFVAGVALSGDDLVNIMDVDKLLSSLEVTTPGTE